MKKMQLSHSSLYVPNIGLGCMRLNKLSKLEAGYVIQNALDLGVNFFDHADIYGGGESESIFSEAIDMTPAIREKMVIQTKTGIRDGFFDFSKEHILASVDDSLKRLQTDYIDVLLLHRPDTLVEPEEVAEAFTILENSGKVRHFGVSNQNPSQVELLKKNVEQDLLVNQLQFGIMHTGMIDTGFNVNMQHEPSLDRDGSILDYSRLNNMTIQAWSPFHYGVFKGIFIDNEKFPELNETLQNIAETYEVTKSAIAIAWILRHPANIQTIVGTMTPDRLKAIAKASDVKITRQEWYEIYRVAGNELP